jgi:hypothetical protein
MALTPAQVATMDQAFYAAATRRSQPIVPQPGLASGGVVSIKMPKAGIGTHLLLTISGTLSRTEGATVGTVTASPYGPWNAVQALSFTDYAGVTRLGNLNGWQLQIRRLIQILRQSSQLLTIGGAAPSWGSAVYAFSIPAGVASSTTTSAFVMQLLVPFSIRENSVRGSYPFTVPDGESTLSFTLQPAVAMAAAGATPSPDNIVLIPNVAGATTTVSLTNVTVSGTFYYYDAATGTPSPVGEISQVYELVRTRKTGLSAGNPAQFTLLTGRTYLRMFNELVLNGLPDTLDVQAVKFMENGATPIRGDNMPEYQAYSNDRYGQPLPAGSFIFDWFTNPWDPSSYGSLDTQLQISAAATIGTVAWLDVTRECLYVASQQPQLVKAGSAA